MGAAKPPTLPQRVLDYAQGVATAHSLTVALLLCAPGVLCWTIWLVHEFIGDPRYPFNNVPVALISNLLPAAIVTGAVSVGKYAHRPLDPKPWFVYLNLAVNVIGLFFATVQIILVIGSI
jgi:hypothetical protein